VRRSSQDEIFDFGKVDCKTEEESEEMLDDEMGFDVVDGDELESVSLEMLLLSKSL
jgi:hypothetical protein